MRLPDSVKRRLQKVALFGAALLMAGGAYAVFCLRTGKGVPCLFHLVTGLQCPGCGVSRMLLCLLRLDFSGAWEANPVILCLLLPGGIVAGKCVCQYVKTGNPNPRGLWNAALWGMIVILLVFGVVRNLPVFFG